MSDETPLVLSLSGGRTSAKMLHDEILRAGGVDKYNSQFITAFCNTGKERNETLDFVRDIQQHWGVGIVWLEYTRVPATLEIANVYRNKKSRDTVLEQVQKGLTTHWFKVVTYETARRRDEPNTPFDELLDWSSVLPNVQNRVCSVQMKVRTIMRYLFERGIYKWTPYIGIRADESHRALDIIASSPKYRAPKFPLVETNQTEEDVMRFWSSNDFDLKLKSYQGNCDLCFLKKLSKRIRIAQEDPQCVEWWLMREKDMRRRHAAAGTEGDGDKFRLGEPIDRILKLAKTTNQASLMDDPGDTDIACGCGDKGFVISEETNCEA